jgi:hypothetical protein
MPSLTEQDLDDVRRAAFELRQTNPAEAVRVLRRLARKGGEIEPLVHGALGEILLDDFEDVDGALHHFRKLLQLAPGLAAAELGLARALTKHGDDGGAQEAYVRALAGFEALAAGAKESTGEEAGAGADEAVLTALELSLEERDLARQFGRQPKTKPSAEMLEWAEKARLFDDPEDADDRADWARFAQLRAELIARDGDLPAALKLVDTLAAFAPLTLPFQALIRSHLYESAKDFARAADEALQAIADTSEPEETFRCAALLSEAKRAPEARQVLEKLRDRAAADPEWPADAKQELVDMINSHLGELASSGLVSLGRGGRGGLL